METEGATPPATKGRDDALGLPDVESLAGLDAPSLEAVLADADGMRRRLEAYLAEGLRLAEVRRHHAADRHRAVTAWASASLNWSRASALRVLRNGRALEGLPAVRAAARAGRLGADQLDEFGRLWANPRVRRQLQRDEQLLLGLAQQHWFDDFATAARRWLSLADADGAQRSHAAAHAARSARMRLVGSEGLLSAQCGTPDAVLLREILDRFTDAEFHADCHDARRRLGRDVTDADLERTPAQRRFDALRAIFLTAAAGSPGEIGIDPLVNIVLDQATAQEVLRRAGGEVVPPPPAREFVHRRCETSDGVPLPLDAVLAALLVGRIRGFITDAKGVVIHLGRTQRLFRGAARDAVRLQQQGCPWPGCTCRADRTQVDHLVPWRAGGTTDPHNGALMCGPHNRWKERGYRTVRRNGGRWDVYRPDGTLIGAHARAPAA
jgi:hypothetical protein